MIGSRSRCGTGVKRDLDSAAIDFLEAFRRAHISQNVGPRRKGVGDNDPGPELEIVGVDRPDDFWMAQGCSATPAVFRMRHTATNALRTRAAVDQDRLAGTCIGEEIVVTGHAGDSAIPAPPGLACYFGLVTIQPRRRTSSTSDLVEAERTARSISARSSSVMPFCLGAPSVCSGSCFRSELPVA